MLRAMAEGASSTKKGILIGCGVALALGVCGIGSCFAFCGGGMYYAIQQTEAPAAAGRAFLTALGNDDMAGAQANMSGPYRARVTPERLKQLAAEHTTLKGISDITFGQRGIDDSGAKLGGTVTSPSGTTGVELELIEEGKAWKVDRASVAGLPLE
jgi:hypothetical protein